MRAHRRNRLRRLRGHGKLEYAKHVSHFRRVFTRRSAHRLWNQQRRPVVPVELFAKHAFGACRDAAGNIVASRLRSRAARRRRWHEGCAEHRVVVGK